MKRTVIFTFVFLLLAAVVGGFAYFQYVMKPEMLKGIMAQAGVQPVTVAAEAARSESWDPKIPAIGTVVAVQGIDVAPQVGGIVRAIHFDSGQTVEAGALLVEIDDFVEQADLKSNVAVLRKSELDLERQRELLTRGNTPQTSYDAALSQRDTAAAAVERTRAVIAQKAVKAPFRGRLGIRTVSLGQYVSPGTALVTLQKLDPVFVDFPLPEQHLDVLRNGQVVEILVDAFPDETFVGSISSIDAKVNQETRNVLVRAEVGNADRRLLPGMFANVNVVAGTARQVVTLPRTAVIYSLYGDSVYAVKRESDAATAERRFVRVGETRDERVSIAEGVTAGDEIVTTGQLKLQPGVPVRIDNTTPLRAQAVRPKE